jgi:hypothetical protein
MRQASQLKGQIGLDGTTRGDCETRSEGLDELLKK